MKNILLKPYIIFQLLVFVSTDVSNLTDGSSCAFNYHCQSQCCDFGSSSSNILGYYCYQTSYCTSMLLKPGQSCSSSGQCETKCCESGFCQANNMCFQKYILPFIIIFGVVVLFLVMVAVILVCYKRKMKQAKNSLKGGKKLKDF